MGLLKDELRKFLNDRNRRNIMISSVTKNICKGEKVEADELFQQVITRFLKKIEDDPKFAKKNIDDFDKYFFTSIKNQSRDNYRKENTKKRKALKDYLERQREEDKLLYDEPMIDKKDEKIDILDVISSTELSDILNKCIPDETNRMIFIDSKVNKMRYQQMVEKYQKMEIVTKKKKKPFTRKALRTRVSRMKKELRAYLLNKNGNDGE